MKEMGGNGNNLCRVYGKAKSLMQASEISLADASVVLCQFCLEPEGVAQW